MDSADAEPEIFAAELGPDGIVYRLDPLSFDDAVDRRRVGGDIVVRGADLKRNRKLAMDIEIAANGYAERGAPHTRSAGAYALPHFQPRPRPVGDQGHSFYETPNRKSRRKP